MSFCTANDGQRHAETCSYAECRNTTGDCIGAVAWATPTVTASTDALSCGVLVGTGHCLVRWCIIKQLQRGFDFCSCSDCQVAAFHCRVVAC